jgi:hypothetical protein
MNYELKFGKPGKYSYNMLLNQFSCTNISSPHTSSIPLAQFWKKTSTPLRKLEKNLKKFGTGLKLDNSELCFEYPTAPLQGTGGPSMTDLMILPDTGNTKIAIEAKYTECVKMEEETVCDWRKKNGDTQNQKDVVQSWWDMIKKFRTVPNTNDTSIDYQFLHRTASACKGAKLAIVISQLFYDKKTDLNEFKTLLQKYVNIIKPEDSKLKFYIWEIAVIPPIPTTIDPNPFIEMKGKDVYKFGKQDFNQLTVTN